MIAMKREVADAPGIRFSVERMSSYQNWRQVTVQRNDLQDVRNMCVDFGHTRVSVQSPLVVLC